MKTFEYRGFGREGQAARGLVEAGSPKEAREKLMQQGVLAERIHATGRRLRFSADQRATVYRELGSLLSAGIPLTRALENLIQSEEMGETRVLLAGIRDRVREGSSLADAFAHSSDAVSAFETAIIEAAERTATVEKMLDRLAEFIEDQERLRERIQSALIYPSLVLGVGVVVAILMLGLLLPRTRQILAGTNVPLPGLTVFMIGLGKFLMIWSLPLLALLALWILHCRRRYREDVEYRRGWDRRLFGLPLFGRGYTLLVNLRFTRTLAILIHGGVPLIDGVQMAGRATGSPWVSHLADGAAQAVRHGTSLSEAVRTIPPLGGSLPGWIQTGEASGDLERLMEKAGQKYSDNWTRFTQRCLSFLEPVLILVIGGFVLLVTLSVLLPVLSLTNAVGR